MNTGFGIAALLAIAGATLLIHEADHWWKRRQQKKRLMKIQLCAQSCDEQERREA